MPAVSPARLIDAVLDAFLESGCQAQLYSPLRQHPRKFRVIQPNGIPFNLWVYMWTITHGGFPRSEEEYRIQMTSVSSPLDLNPDGVTVLLGWFPSTNIFGGFDLSKHRTFTQGSPSVQISLTALNSALNFGMGFSQKDNHETAVAFRPDQILNYCLNAAALHEHGAGARMLGLLEKATKVEVIESNETEGLATPRKKLVQTVEKWARDANFADNVLNAYGRRCAVTRAQLKLVDAAHIYPVGAEGSTDRVTNGIALSPTYHRAFDHGLIFLDTNLKMRINAHRVSLLESLKLTDGLSAFSHFLEKQIHLPADPRQRPALEMIRKANSFRRIAV